MVQWDLGDNLDMIDKTKKQIKLGIVGSSKATYSDYDSVMLNVKSIMNNYDVVEIVSGCANGIDSIAERVANDLGIKFVPFPPAYKGKTAYFLRNKQIAEYSDIVICFALKYTGKPCYHCNLSTHDKTAGCWTANYAKRKGKKTELFII